MHQLPSVDYLNECFQYVKHTGDLIWKTRPSGHFASEKGSKIFNSTYAGTVAGSKDTTRVKAVMLKEKTFLISNIIWKMHNGTDLERTLIHKDGDHQNTKIENLEQRAPLVKKDVVKQEVKYALKDTSVSKTTRNKKIKTLSSDEKLKYVTKTPDGLYLSRINVKGKQTYVGRYTNAHDAHIAAVNCLKLVNG